MGRKRQEDLPLIKLIKGIISAYYDWKERRERQRNIEHRSEIGQDKFSMKQHRKDLKDAQKQMKKGK